MIFENVLVRVSPSYKLEMHLDLEEGNAAAVKMDKLEVCYRNKKMNRQLKDIIQKQYFFSDFKSPDKFLNLSGLCCLFLDDYRFSFLYVKPE